MQAIFDQGRAEPCPAEFNMARYVLENASADPDKTALSIVGGKQPENWSYGQLTQAVYGTAMGLRELGLKPGDQLLLRLGNSVNFPIAYLAAIAVGIIPVPTSTQLTGPEISVIAKKLEPKMIIAANGAAVPDPVSGQIIGEEQLERMRTLPPAKVEMGDPDRPAYIIFTSGTGGSPRGVVHAHRAVWARRMMWQGWYGLTPDDRLLHAGAFNWTYTLGTGLMDPWAMGATALIPAPGITPTKLPALLAQENVTIFAAAPGVFRQMLRAPFPPVPGLRHALSAGEKLPDATRKGWSKASETNVYEAYGMSECSTFISAAPTSPLPTGATGRPQTGRRVAILSETGVAQVGEPGVIAIGDADQGLMLGYLDDPETTRARHRDGWFLTGDNGQMAEDGAVTFLGRDDDMMNAGGFRVSPLEVENAMRRHPGVTDCAAVEVSVKSDVAVIALFYQSDNLLSQKDLSDHAEQVLARYKQPRLFRPIDELPRGANGKLLRRQLRKVENPS